MRQLTSMNVVTATSQNPITGVRKEDTTPISAKIHPKMPSKVDDNVADKQRKSKADEVKTRFNDVFQVSDQSNCGNIDADITNYSDDINVAASLSMPSSIEFF